MVPLYRVRGKLNAAARKNKLRWPPEAGRYKEARKSSDTKSSRLAGLICALLLCRNAKNKTF